MRQYKIGEVCRSRWRYEDRYKYTYAIVIGDGFNYKGSLSLMLDATNRTRNLWKRPLPYLRGRFEKVEAAHAAD